MDRQDPDDPSNQSPAAAAASPAVASLAPAAPTPLSSSSSPLSSTSSATVPSPSSFTMTPAPCLMLASTMPDHAVGPPAPPGSMMASAAPPTIMAPPPFGGAFAGAPPSMAPPPFGNVPTWMRPPPAVGSAPTWMAPSSPFGSLPPGMAPSPFGSLLPGMAPSPFGSLPPGMAPLPFGSFPPGMAPLPFGSFPPGMAAPLPFGSFPPGTAQRRGFGGARPRLVAVPRPLLSTLCSAVGPDTTPGRLGTLSPAALLTLTSAPVHSPQSSPLFSAPTENEEPLPVGPAPCATAQLNANVAVLALPTDVWHHILSFVVPTDSEWLHASESPLKTTILGAMVNTMPSLALTCRRLRQIVLMHRHCARLTAPHLEVRELRSMLAGLVFFARLERIDLSTALGSLQNAVCAAPSRLHSPLQLLRTFPTDDLECGNSWCCVLNVTAWARTSLLPALLSRAKCDQSLLSLRLPDCLGFATPPLPSTLKSEDGGGDRADEWDAMVATRFGSWRQARFANVSRLLEPCARFVNLRELVLPACLMLDAGDSGRILSLLARVAPRLTSLHATLAESALCALTATPTATDDAGFAFAALGARLTSLALLNGRCVGHGPFMESGDNELNERSLPLIGRLTALRRLALLPNFLLQPACQEAFADTVARLSSLERLRFFDRHLAWPPSAAYGVPGHGGGGGSGSALWQRWTASLPPTLRRLDSPAPVLLSSMSVDDRCEWVLRLPHLERCWGIPTTPLHASVGRPAELAEALSRLPVGGCALVSLETRRHDWSSTPLGEAANLVGQGRETAARRLECVSLLLDYHPRALATPNSVFCIMDLLRGTVSCLAGLPQFDWDEALDDPDAALAGASSERENNAFSGTLFPLVSLVRVLEAVCARCDAHALTHHRHQGTLTALGAALNQLRMEMPPSDSPRRTAGWAVWRRVVTALLSHGVAAGVPVWKPDALTWERDTVTALSMFHFLVRDLPNAPVAVGDASAADGDEGSTGARLSVLLSLADLFAPADERVGGGVVDAESMATMTASIPAAVRAVGSEWRTEWLRLFAQLRACGAGHDLDPMAVRDGEARSRDGTPVFDVRDVSQWFSAFSDDWSLWR